MKKFLTLGLICIVLGVVYMYREDLFNAYKKYFVNQRIKVSLDDKNDFYRNQSFNFVQITNNFEPHSKQDIYNIYYTAINAGKNKFTFYCPKEYKDCIDEIKYLAKDQVTLSNINNFVHPFNGFKHIETTYDTTGKVTLKIYHTYSSNDIDVIRDKVNAIEAKLKDDSLSVQDQIKVYHDYIIDNTVYDSNRSDNNMVQYRSDTAYGTLLQGYSLCGGYTDSMAIILNDMGIVNYKISSDDHIWNAVKINNTWYHLDLTWDDPVTSDGTNLIEHDFFLVDTNTLLKEESDEHNFDQTVYSELAQN